MIARSTSKSGTTVTRHAKPVQIPTSIALIGRAIDFSGDEIRALPRKTQARRIVEPMPGLQRKWLTRDTINAVPHGAIIDGGWQMHHPKSGTMSDGVFVADDSPLGWIRCPFGEPGDRLRVREPWHPSEGGPIFFADSEWAHAEEAAYYAGIKRWRSPRSLPREHSRHVVEVTGVRCERIQSITEADAEAEGAYPMSSIDLSMLIGRRSWPAATYVTGFGFEWREEHGREAWDANAWVWVISFRTLVAPKRVAR